MISDIYEIDRYTRDILKAHPKDIFVFGDNMQRQGLGGQAASCRHEPNAVGIPTKWKPSYQKDAYFSNDDFDFVYPIITGAFESLRMYRRTGFNIWLPRDGIGTGRARLKEKAPYIYKLIVNHMNFLKSPKVFYQ